MSLRTLGLVTLTGTAQPVLGDVTTAITPAPVDGPYTTITVASNVLYQAGDRIVLEPGTTNADAYTVEQKTTILNGASTTQLQCRWEGGAGVAHASGVILQLSLVCIDMVVKLLAGSTGNLVIGADATVTAVPAGSLITVIYKSAANVETMAWHMAGSTGNNIENTADAWMIGNVGDKVAVYALVL